MSPDLRMCTVTSGYTHTAAEIPALAGWKHWVRNHPGYTVKSELTQLKP